MERRERLICPLRILEFAIHGFVLGTIGGVLYHAVKGTVDNQAPKVTVQKMTRAPYFGVGVAATLALYSTIDCSLSFVRGTDTRFNHFVSGATTGAIISAKRAPQHIVGNALLMGALFWVFD